MRCRSRMLLPCPVRASHIEETKTPVDECIRMINKPPPFKGLNSRIPIKIPIKGWGLLIRGLD